MNDDIPQLRTIGVIANATGATTDQVNRIIKKHNIRPCGRAGCLRVFSREAEDAVRAELAKKQPNNSSPFVLSLVGEGVFSSS